MGRGVLLELGFANKEKLVSVAVVGGSLGCKMVEFLISCGRNKAVNRIAALNFKRANFDFFKDVLGGIPWTRVLEGKRAQEEWLVL